MAAVLIAAGVGVGLLFGWRAAGIVVAILIVVFLALGARDRVDDLGGPDVLKKRD